MSIFDNRGPEKPELTMFSKDDYQNLINALEITYYEYWSLLDKNFKQKCEKELFRLVDCLYTILTEKRGFINNLCLTIRDLELILLIINEALKLKNDIDLKNAQKLLVTYFKSFYSQFDIIIDNEK